LKKTPPDITTIGLVANLEKRACRGALRRAAGLILRSGRQVLTDPLTAAFAGLDIPTSAGIRSLARRSQLLLVFGGDGTMLRVARDIAGAATPILGVNTGRLGFLTAIQIHQLPGTLLKIWAGNFTLESRPLIEAVRRDDRPPISFRALNEVVIGRGAHSRMIELDVAVDAQKLIRYRCDGLIVASPTGSTAYSLSAGGVIVSPEAEVFTLTPICPHALSNRSVIVSLNSIIEVRVLTEKLETILTADGQVQAELQVGDVISLRRSRQRVRLLRLPGTSFFDTLRRKFKWTGSNV
jgi:NAD+ kinase